MRAIPASSGSPKRAERHPGATSPGAATPRAVLPGAFSPGAGLPAKPSAARSRSGWLPGLLACVLTGATAWSPVTVAAGADAPVELTEVAPGVLVHLGAVALTTAGNRGDIANLGAIVGERCVAIIDTGGSPAVGAALRRAVALRTALPVCHVINTHGHPDHVLGNAGFAADRPDFIGHARLAPALAVRGPGYQRAAREALGPGADLPALIPPTRIVQDRLELDLGGRRLDIQAWPAAHTDQDLTVTDLATGVIFVGDLVFDQHLPVLDGNLKGWLTALARLQALPVTLAIPGHGRPAAIGPLIAPQQAYLEDLRSRVGAAIARQQPLAPTVEALGKAPGPADARTRWSLIEAFHRRNVTAAYAELEWD